VLTVQTRENDSFRTDSLDIPLAKSASLSDFRPGPFRISDFKTRSVDVSCKQRMRSVSCYCDPWASHDRTKESRRAGKLPGYESRGIGGEV